jgi:hypothetical protein
MARSQCMSCIRFYFSQRFGFVLSGISIGSLGQYAGVYDIVENVTAVYALVFVCTVVSD